MSVFLVIFSVSVIRAKFLVREQEDRLILKAQYGYSLLTDMIQPQVLSNIMLRLLLCLFISPSKLHFLFLNVNTGTYCFQFIFFNSVNIVIPSSKSVVAEAIKLAQEITANSPDAIQATKHGLLLAQNLGPIEAVQAHVWSRHSERLYEGRNIKEGLQAFVAVCPQFLFSLL